MKSVKDQVKGTAFVQLINQKRDQVSFQSGSEVDYQVYFEIRFQVEDQVLSKVIVEP
jgi:hypothetical protein